MTHRNIILVGATLCLLAVVIGAFGAHLMADLLARHERLDVFQLANRYQFYHGLALMIVAAIALQNNIKLAAPAWLMLIGVVIFSGSLYLLSLTGITWLGAITPIGGTFLILAWIMMLHSFWRIPK